MTVYALGDIQGCYDPFRRLLDKINFEPSSDLLWLTGDIVNRGPKSLQTLRFVKSLGNSVKMVLGNHECHLIATARGHKKSHKRDTLSDIIEAHDASELLDWLRAKPFFYEDKKLGYCMLHAGLPPQWTLKEAKQYARELETVIQGPHIDDFLSTMYGNQPKIWDKQLSGNDRLRFIINCFTRLRYCDKNGKLNLKEKGKPGTQAAGLMPWFDVPGRKTIDQQILFGHWSTLGLHYKKNTYCLDTGCLWGGELSALKLDGSNQVITQPCECSLKPF